jgi:hypothetical protein
MGTVIDSRRLELETRLDDKVRRTFEAIAQKGFTIELFKVLRDYGGLRTLDCYHVRLTATSPSDVFPHFDANAVVDQLTDLFLYNNGFPVTDITVRDNNEQPIRIMGRPNPGYKSV